MALLWVFRPGLSKSWTSPVKELEDVPNRMPYVTATNNSKEVFLKFLPLLSLYLLYGVLHNRESLRCDESRYLVYAHNILNGFFASQESLMFWNGPGYPLFLAPFMALKWPLIVPRLVNGLFLYFAMIYLYHILRESGVVRRAYKYTYAVGILLLWQKVVVLKSSTLPITAFILS